MIRCEEKANARMGKYGFFSDSNGAVMFVYRNKSLFDEHSTQLHKLVFYPISRMLTKHMLPESN